MNDRQISTHSYQIERGGNYVRTELSFEDSSFRPRSAPNTSTALEDPFPPSAKMTERS
ncbi:MAG: hypothetical protein IPJ00_11010 [Saprospirales bacterium]|nr:hypothetical protein [Saprospirales bacterium]